MSPKAAELARLMAQEETYLPPGQGVRYLIPWDRLFNYNESDTRHLYVWRVENSVVSYDDEALTIRQTLFSDGNGSFRKHEADFVIHGANIESIEPMDYPSDSYHMAADSTKPPMCYRLSGPPKGIRIELISPIMVRRWSCNPITAIPMEQKAQLDHAIIWFANSWLANSAKSILEEVAELARQASASSTFPLQEDSRTAPGSIRRF